MDDGGGPWDGSVYQSTFASIGITVPYFAKPPPTTYTPYSRATPRVFAPSPPAQPRQARSAISWELVGGILGIAAGAALCIGTAGVGCVVAGALIATAFSTAGYIADNPGAKSEDIAANLGTNLAMSLVPVCRGGVCKLAGKEAVAGTKGWTVGGDIYTSTRSGKAPAWSTVRSRFWKNEAANPAYGPWDASTLARMNKGGAPQRFNPAKGGKESMELSHEPIPFRDGGTNVVPRWPQDHARVDPYRRPGY